MINYREFVAGRARALMQIMEGAGQSDRKVAELLRAMRSKLESIARGEVDLPSRLIDAYGPSFGPGAFNSLCESHPAVVIAEAELSFALRCADVESYQEALRLLCIRAGKGQ